MVARRVLASALLLGALVSSSCKEREPAPSSRASSTAGIEPASASPSSAPSGSASPTAAVSVAAAPPDAGTDAGSNAGSDAGADGGNTKTAGTASAGASSSPASSANPAATHEDCRLVRGPAQLSFTGPASVAFGEGDKAATDIRVIFNRAGEIGAQAPSFKEVKPGPVAGLLPKKPEPKPSVALVPEKPPSPEKASHPACAVASRYIFCMDHEGAIHRRVAATGEGDTIVARGRPGATIAAATLGADHIVLAFLANQKTTEGIITQAFVVLDEGPPVLLSEEGSGATFVALLPRGGDVLAMYIDARVALTPVHARTVSAASGKLTVGRDAVVFVGDASERRMGGAIAWPGQGRAHLLVPSLDHGDKFGMASLGIDGEPKDDVPAVWSHYAKEISPAPVAATQGVSPVRVARVRPVSVDAGSWRALELGHLNGDGVFSPLCTLVESKSFTDVRIAAGPGGALWIVYTSADGTWVEQRGR